MHIVGVKSAATLRYAGSTSQRIPCQTRSTNDKLGAVVVRPAGDAAEVVIVADKVVDVAVGASTGTRMALHGLDAAVVALAGQGSARRWAGGLAGGILSIFVVKESVIGARICNAD